MMTHWQTLVLVAAVSGVLAACAPKQPHGGGAGPQPVASNRLPNSNDVNPSVKPNNYIDRATKQKAVQRKSP